MQETTYYNSKWKWYTMTEWVDIDTGEMIPKHEKEKNYRIVGSEIKEEKYTTHGVRTYIRMCKQKEQLKLEL